MKLVITGKSRMKKLVKETIHTVKEQRKCFSCGKILENDEDIYAIFDINGKTKICCNDTRCLGKLHNIIVFN